MFTSLGWNTRNNLPTGSSRGMSIQIPPNPQTKRAPSLPKKVTFRQESQPQPSLFTINSPNVSIEHFGIVMKNEVTVGSGVYFSYNVPQLMSTERQVEMTILGGQIYLINVPSSQFETEIYLYATGVTGYSDNSGSPTEKVAIFRARQIVSTQHIGVIYYNVIYSVLDVNSWRIGSGTTLDFKLGDSTGMYSSKDLPSKVSVEFKLQHLSY